MNKNVMKLSRLLLRLNSVKAIKDNTEYEFIFEGELSEGTEVYIKGEGEGEDFEMISPEDGEYQIDKQIVVIESGKVVEIKENVEPEPEVTDPEPEPEPENLADPITEDQLKELQDTVAERDQVISELTTENEALKKEIEELKSKLQEADEKLSMSSDKPAFEEIKDNTPVASEKEINALKYFK